MSDHPAARSGQEPPNAAATAAITVEQAAEAMVSLIQTTIGTVLGPLVGQLDAQRQTIERQADRVAELERENGRQQAELERAGSTIVSLGEQNEALRASQAKQDANPGPEVLAPTTAPVQHQINPGALLPWVLTVLAVVGGGRAAVADVSPEALLAGAGVFAVVVVAYVVWKRVSSRSDAGRGGGP